MDEEVFEIAKDNDLSLKDAQEIQALVDGHGIDIDTALKAKEIMDEEGLDEDDAAALADLL